MADLSFLVVEQHGEWQLRVGRALLDNFPGAVVSVTASDLAAVKSAVSYSAVIMSGSMFSAGLPKGLGSYAGSTYVLSNNPSTVKSARPIFPAYIKDEIGLSSLVDRIRYDLKAKF